MFRLKPALYQFLACHDGAEVSASGLKIGRSPVQISPKTNFSTMIKLPVKSTGKYKAASDSTLKQLTTCGASNTCTFLLFFSFQFSFYFIKCLQIVIICIFTCLRN